MSWHPHVTVAAVIMQDDKYLLVEELIDNKLVLNQPAGHLEAGEDLLTAINREVLEETTRKFHAAGLVGIYRWQMPDSTQTYLRFCFTGSVSEPLPDLEIDHEIVRTLWLTEAEIILRQADLRSPMVLQCLRDAATSELLPLAALHNI